MLEAAFDQAQFDYTPMVILNNSHVLTYNNQK